MSMFKKTEVYTIDGFLRGDAPIRIEGGVPPSVKQAGKIVAMVSLYAAASGFMLPPGIAEAAGPITPLFDKKIWPYVIDIGTPLAKTMMAVGIYKCIRGNTDAGWLIVRRAGFGLIALYLIDGAVNIISGIGSELAK